jgi:Protein of unknown function (DUF1488)
MFTSGRSARVREGVEFEIYSDGALAAKFLVSEEALKQMEQSTDRSVDYAAAFTRHRRIFEEIASQKLRRGRVGRAVTLINSVDVRDYRQRDDHN